MEITLTTTEKAKLEKRHRQERDGRVRDRIKAVLLKSEGWSIQSIAQATRRHPDTIAGHLQDWATEEKLKPENGGSISKLSAEQESVIDEHLQKHCYTKVSDICQYVLTMYAVSYTVSGMTKWLRSHGFRDKQPKIVPSKLNPDSQADFIKKYRALCAQKLPNDVVIFLDASHPTMATKISHGWIKKGSDKLLKQTASRTRVNVIGAIELDSMQVQSSMVDSVNTETTLQFLKEIKAAYPNAPNLHIILDQAGYHRSQKFKEEAQFIGVKLHYLPPYSPNLNPIERLWKVMNEECRNNVFFHSAAEFRHAIDQFFEKTVHDIKDVLRSRINDNFQILKPVSSG